MRTATKDVIRLILVGGIVGAAASPATAQVTTPVQAIDRATAYLGSQLIGAAEAMPEEHFHSSPNKGTSTFAQQIKHVAINNYLSAAIMTQQPTPPSYATRRTPQPKRLCLAIYVDHSRTSAKR